jgi:GrpB-like predicted nucleotidyltransferase (UPF0157 family)
MPPAEPPVALFTPDAQAAFDAIARELALLLPDAHVTHIGASAVPGALSKGDLDVCVAVPPGQHAAACARLQAAGYRVKADTLRTDTLCHLVAPRGDVDAALQLVAHGSAFERMFLGFLAALQARPGLVREYNALKRESADQGMTAYRAAKAGFIERVLADAPHPSPCN